MTSSKDYASCQSESEHSLDSAALSTKIPTVSVDPLVKQAQLVHALVEWVLGLRWVEPTTPNGIQAAHIRAFRDNPYSRSLDVARPNRASVWLSSQQLPPPNSLLCSISDYLEEVGEDGSDINGIVYISFENAERVLTRLCQLYAPRHADSYLLTLALIYSRADTKALAKQLVTERIARRVVHDTLEGETDLAEKLRFIQRLTVNTAGLRFTCPEFFPGCEPLSDSERAALWRTFFITPVPGFFPEFINTLRDDWTEEMIAEFLFKPVADSFYHNLLGRRMCNPLHAEVQALQNGLSICPEFARCLAQQPYFVPSSPNNMLSKGGWHLMTESLLGRLLRPTPLDQVRTADEPERFQPASDHYFSGCMRSSATGVMAMLNRARTEWNGILDQVVQIVKTLLKCGGQVKDAALKWFAEALERNRAFGTLGFRQLTALFNSMGPFEVVALRSQGLCTTGFGMNVAMVLLKLCDPVTLGKIPDLSLLYPAICRKFPQQTLLGKSIQNEGRYSDDDQVNEAVNKVIEKECGAKTEAPPVKFTTQIFWLALKSAHVFVLPAYHHFEAKHRNHEESRINPQEDLCWTAVLANDHFADSFSHLALLSSGVLLHAAFGFDQDGNRLPDDSDCQSPLLTPLGVTESMVPRSLKPPPQFAALPASYFNDLFVTVSKLIFLNTSHSFSPLDLENMRRADRLFTPENADLFAGALILLLMDPRKFIHQSMKLEGAGHNLLALSIPKQLSNTMSRTHSFIKHYARALVVAFVECHKATYYQRIEMRLLLTREFQRCLDDSGFVRNMVDLSSRDHELFERFLHYFGGNASWVLEEGLISLAEIKKKEAAPPVDSQSTGETSGQRNQIDALRDRARHRAANEDQQQQQPAENQQEDDDVAGALEGNRNVSEMPMEELVSHCKSLMDGGFISLDVLKKLMVHFADFVRKSEVLSQQLVLYLNSCMNSLVGPRCLELKVSNFAAYNFKPRELLASLCLVYCSLASGSEGAREEVAGYIVAEDRYYKPELFVKSVKILRREGLLGKAAIDDFAQLESKCEEKYAESTAFASTILADVPDEFLDPIMSDIMTDPVKLPASGVIMERKVIERHLMSEEFDPFNRAPLTKAELIAEPELKARIHAYLAEARRKIAEQKLATNDA